MHPLTTFAAIALFVCTIASRSAAQILFDPGFEQPITSDGAPFVGSWEGFSGGAGASAGNSTLMPRSGAQHLNLSITSSNNNFAGVFQDVPVSAGLQYVFGGYHMTPSSPFDVGSEIRIEWRDASTEISRTPNFAPSLTGAYAPFSLTATAPVGAQFARVVYAIQSFGPEPTNTGTVYLDDLSFVPEPTSLTLLAGSALLLARRRRVLRP
jgi:hypothetical protein